MVLLNAYFLYPSGNDIWGSVDVSVLGYSLGLIITYWAAFEYRFRYMPKSLSMTIFENIDQGLALFDDAVELIMHNQRSAELLGKKLPAKMPSRELTGYTAAEARGMSQFDLIPPEDRQHYIVMVGSQFSRGNVAFLQHEILKKDGDRIRVLCMGRKYYDSALKVYRSEIFITPATAADS